MRTSENAAPKTKFEKEKKISCKKSCSILEIFNFLKF